MVGQCEHTRVVTGRKTAVDHSRILVSPSRTAHLPGCPHNDESDLSEWGEIQDVPWAWERLGNGEQLGTNAGAVLERPAVVRCRDCEAR